jgi:hypothetical protein
LACGWRQHATGDLAGFQNSHIMRHDCTYHPQIYCIAREIPLNFPELLVPSPNEDRGTKLIGDSPTAMSSTNGVIGRKIRYIGKISSSGGQ